VHIVLKDQLLRSYLFIAILVCVATTLYASDKDASIAITTIPHAGVGGTEEIEVIGGTVTGIGPKKCADYRVVVYAHAGGQWWVQPTFDSPLTGIDSQCKWQTETHLGGVYAALLVRASYVPVGKISSLPAPSASGDIISIVRANGLPPAK